MKRALLMNYKEKSIFYMNFSDMRNLDDIRKVIEESKEYIRKQPPQSVRTLTYVEGMHFNTDIKNEFSKFMEGNRKYVLASSVVGLTGLIRIVFNGVNRVTGRQIRSFDNMELAKDWLATRESLVIL